MLAEYISLGIDLSIQIGSGTRSEKIRSYNFPQSRITEHRLSKTIHNLSKFMDGDLDEILSDLQESEEQENRQSSLAKLD